jgi:hypothetical protein
MRTLAQFDLHLSHIRDTLDVMGREGLLLPNDERGIRAALTSARKNAKRWLKSEFADEGEA